MEKVLIVSAHPDDMELGMGGVINRFRGNVHFSCLILALPNYSARDVKIRIKTVSKFIDRSTKFLDVGPVYIDNLRDNEFDSHPLLEIIKKIEEVIKKEDPDTIFTHSEKDLNIDHVLTNKAVITACRPKCNNVKSIYAFEVLSSTNFNPSTSFNPNVYFKLNEKDISTKQEAFSLYKTENMDFPHPRSMLGIDTLAKVRGMECGEKFAEGFELMRRSV